MSLLPQIVLARAALTSAAAFTAEVKRQREAGMYTKAMAAYALEGASEYVIAIANGDLASDQYQAERLDKCRSCASRVPHATNPNTRLGTCGPAFEDRRKEKDRPTCGCPIEPMVQVASKECPQKLFPSVPKVGST
jgi:hypothetical protein